MQKGDQKYIPKNSKTLLKKNLKDTSKWNYNYI